MKQGRLIGFNAKALSEQIMAKAVEEQTRRLIEYAENKIKEIGDKINSYNSRHHMDRTGNLLNSLCWGVAYSGELKASGFYREEIIHGDRGRDTKNHPGESFLHEFFEEDIWLSFPVEGHALAAEYIERYGKISWKGRWRVFFAVLAPYWGFWEEGFTLIHGIGKGEHGKGFNSASFRKFAVMTEFYDQVSKELKPAKVNFKITKSHRYTRYSTVNKKGEREWWGSLERAKNRRDERERWNKRK